MTNQEILNTVVNHLWNQKVPAMHTTGCCYRTPDGLKCAIGCLITDVEYNPKMEHKNVENITTKFHIKAITNTSVTFLGDLQDLHDRIVAKTSWGLKVPQTMIAFKNQIKIITQRWGLTFDVDSLV